MKKNYLVVLTAKDVLEILGIGRTKAYQLVNSNEFPINKFGNSIRIPTKTFLNWMNGEEVV